MAEVLAVTGGVAGLAQILHYIIKASGVLTNICHEVKDAPCALRQIRDGLNLLKATLETFQRFLTQGDVDAILEREVRQLLENSIQPVYDCTEQLDHILQNFVGSGTVKKRNRFEWAFFIRRMAQKSLEELVDAENTLNRVIQILNL